MKITTNVPERPCVFFKEMPFYEGEKIFVRTFNGEAYIGCIVKIFPKELTLSLGHDQNGKTRQKILNFKDIVLIDDSKNLVSIPD